MKKLLVTHNLSKTYVQTQGFFSRVKTNIHALDGVSFSINQGTTMAVLESLVAENQPLLKV